MKYLFISIMFFSLSAIAEGEIDFPQPIEDAETVTAALNEAKNLLTDAFSHGSADIDITFFDQVQWIDQFDDINGDNNKVISLNLEFKGRFDGEKRTGRGTCEINVLSEQVIGNGGHCDGVKLDPVDF